MTGLIKLPSPGASPGAPESSHTISLEPSLKYKARVGVVGVVVRLRVLLDEFAPP